MDLRRLRAGEWIAAVSGAVLVVSLFLPWYSVDRPAARRVGGQAVDLSAWEVLSIVDVLLFAIGLLAMGLLVLTAIQRTAAVGIAADALLTLAAGVVLLIAAVRVLNLPGDVEAVGGTRAAFAWIGLLATFGVVAGTTVAMRDERLSKPGRPTDATGAPVAAPPQVERLPAPPREPAGQ